MRPLPLSAPRLAILTVILLASATRPVAAQTAPNAAGAAADLADPLAPLLKQVDDALDINSRRFLVANSHSPWQIFHGILALRQNFQVKFGDKKVSAIEWIATSEPKFDNEPLIIITQHGANFHPFTRPYAFQGHPGQFLALLTPSNLPLDFKFRAQGQEVTISHMLRDTMMSVNSQEEVTWVLWSLNHYLKTDASWVNKAGEPWSIERLVQVETASKVENAACGGNHGLFALARARDKFAKGGEPLRGAWLEADHKVKRYAETARSLQNRDGSFSANSYKGPEFSADINTRMNTTGHTLEFLAASLPEARLKEPWVQRAVYTLSKDLIDHRKSPVDCGPLYHSLNSLMIYRDRLRPGVAAQVVLKPTAQSQLVPQASPKVEPQPVVNVPVKITPLPAPAGTFRLPLDGPISALEPANYR